MRDIVIIGAGTAGLTAAIYAARAGKDVLVIEENIYGGQIVNAAEVENYPGIKNISGYDFAIGLYEQAVGLGAEVIMEKVTDLRLHEDIKRVVTTKNQYECRSVIIATGAKNRPLGIEKEKEFVGKGVSYCATCDGAFFRGKDVAVVGGGNTAVSDAVFLSDFCNKVYLIHRRDTFRAENKLMDKLRYAGNIEILTDSSVVSIYGEEHLEAVDIEHIPSSAKRRIEVSGLFIAIGQMPDNDAFSGIVDLDEGGYIVSDERCETKTKGVYAAGDCRTKEIRQLATAAADGAVAAIKASEL